MRARWAVRMRSPAHIPMHAWSYSIRKGKWDKIKRNMKDKQVCSAAESTLKKTGSPRGPFKMERWSWGRGREKRRLRRGSERENSLIVDAVYCIYVTTIMVMSQKDGKKQRTNNYGGYARPVCVQLRQSLAASSSSHHRHYHRHRRVRFFSLLWQGDRSDSHVESTACVKSATHAIVRIRLSFPMMPRSREASFVLGCILCG